VGSAQERFPVKPLKIVVGSEAGSAPDILARALSIEMGQILGKAVVVENKAGATGTIGATAVVTSAPDGYTLLMGTVSNVALAPAFYPVKYDPARSFTSIGMVASVPLVLVASSASGIQNFNQLVTQARSANPAMSYASPGVGGPQHLAGVLLTKVLDSPMLHIPFKSGGAAMTAVASGEIPLAFAGIPAAAGLIKGQKVTPLFVTVPRRSSALPEVPTAAEAGVPGGLHIDNWHALLAPAGVPADVRSTLEAALQKALAVATVREQFQKVGAEATPGSSRQLEEFVLSESARWLKVVSDNKIKVD
jgi:tripartite-type tricarboxylate transporter receptor subunit TctC